LHFKINCLHRRLQGFDILKYNCKTEFEAGKVGIEIMLRNTGSGAVLLPNCSHRQFQDAFHARIANHSAAQRALDAFVNIDTLAFRFIQAGEILEPAHDVHDAFGSDFIVPGNLGHDLEQPHHFFVGL
jgi:hypothetical protein